MKKMENKMTELIKEKEVEFTRCELELDKMMTDAVKELLAKHNGKIMFNEKENFIDTHENPAIFYEGDVSIDFTICGDMCGAFIDDRGEIMIETENKQLPWDTENRQFPWDAIGSLHTKVIVYELLADYDVFGVTD